MNTTINVWLNHAFVHLVEYVTIDESDIEDMENIKIKMFVIAWFVIIAFVINAFVGNKKEMPFECVKCGKMFRSRCGLIFHIERNKECVEKEEYKIRLTESVAESVADY